MKFFEDGLYFVIVGKISLNKYSLGIINFERLSIEVLAERKMINFLGFHAHAAFLFSGDLVEDLLFISLFLSQVFFFVGWFLLIRICQLLL